jgi:hypothetical protein
MTTPDPSTPLEAIARLREEFERIEGQLTILAAVDPEQTFHLCAYLAGYLAGATGYVVVLATPDEEPNT